MRALVIGRPEVACFDIYLYYETGGGGRVAYSIGGDGQRMITNVGGGEEMPRFLRLGDTEMEAIGRALLDEMPADAGMTAALVDTRAVRDRLLTLIEYAMQDGRPRRSEP